VPKFRFFLAVFALITWLGLAATPALAHSQLERAEPAAGARLTASPGSIVLHFSETVSPQFSNIQVLNRARQAVQTPNTLAVGADSRVLSVALPATLPGGIYTVLWRVISAVDGHVTTGSFAFSIIPPGSTPEPTAVTAGLTPAAGTTPNPPAADQNPQGSEQSSPPPPPGRWIWRALAMIGAAVLLGGPLFSSLVIGTGGLLPGLRRELDRRLARLVFGAAALVVVALGADMLYQVASLLGTDAPGALGRFDLAAQLVTTTGYGGYWGLRVVAALALLGYGLWRARGAAGLLLAGEALSSHEAAARGLGGLPLGMLGDLLHLLATAAWVGGLIAFAGVLLPVLRRHDPAATAPLLGRLIPRFSRLAIISVGVLVVTGIANLAVHTLDPGAVVASDYGKVLIFKHLLFLPLLAIGFLNHNVLRPRFVALVVPATSPPSPPPPLLEGEGSSPGGKGVGGAGEAGLIQRFARSVGLEVALGVAVLCCAAGLTLLPPPSPVAATAATTATPTAVAAATSPTSTVAPATSTLEPTATPVVAVLEQTVGGVRFRLETRPDPAGDQFRLDLTRVDPATVPLTDVLKVQLRVIPQDIDAGTTDLPLAQVGPLDPDHQIYTATDLILTLSGAYEFDAEFLRKQADDVRAGFRLTLADDGTLTAAPSEALRAVFTTQPSPPITGTATLDIRILDGQSRPVPDATVKLLPLMPSHGHVEPQSAPAPVAGQPGTYRTRVNFTMGGPWLMILEVTRPGQPPLKISGELDVTDPYATPTPGAKPVATATPVPK
jgi:putative copper export protein/methionine-rich copper-binding protein CopC